MVTNVPLWWGDVDNGGGYACTEKGEYGKSLYLFYLAVNLKLLFKETIAL